MDDECEDCGVTLSPREATFNDSRCDECQQLRDEGSGDNFADDWGQA